MGGSEFKYAVLLQSKREGKKVKKIELAYLGPREGGREPFFQRVTRAFDRLEIFGEERDRLLQKLEECN